MAKRLIDDLVERLEMRRMSVAGLQCTWCPSCLRVATRDPDVKGSHDLLWPGDEACRQTIKFGPIAECVADLRQEAELRDPQ